MKNLTVKAYAELIDKSEKTVYKMIKNETIDAFKQEGKYRVNVDKNLLKVIDRTQKALEEAKAVLASMESAAATPQPMAKPMKTAAKKPAPKQKPMKKSTTKKSTTKKR